MKFNMKKVYAAVLSMMVISLISGSCQKSSPVAKVDAVVSFFSGTATIQSLNSQPRLIVMKDIVKDGDIIETGDKSSVIVQVGEELLVRFEANTKVSVTSITDIAKRVITLDKGKVLSSVTKLKKGNEYFVKTPTAVASVRGTEFLTDFNEGKTVVAVGKGKVSVIKSETQEEKLVDLGNSVVVTDKVEMRELNKVETLELKKLESTPVVKDLQNMTQEELNKNFEQSVKSDEEINVEIDKLSGMTLDDLRLKFKRIDVITMYNGRVIKGVIVDRSKTLKILTPGGIVTVPAKNVKRTGVM